MKNFRVTIEGVSTEPIVKDVGESQKAALQFHG